MNVVHLVSNKVWGGGEQYVLDLCRRLEADGHSVAVITRGREAVDTPLSKPDSLPATCLWAGCSISFPPLV